MNSTCAVPDRLPVFRVTAAKTDVAALHELAGKLMGADSYTMRADDDRITLRARSTIVEAYLPSGGLWIADEAELFEPERTPTLPDDRKARSLADRLVRELRLLPHTMPPFTVEPTTIGGTHVAVLDRRRQARHHHRLDVQVGYGVRLTLPASEGPMPVPIVGGGGKFVLTLGHEGRAIGFRGVWRPVESEAFDVDVIPQAEADDRFRKMTSGLDVRSMSSFLAYYAAPASETQQFLYPVWVYRATAEMGKHMVPLRMVMLPASTFGPPPAEPAPQPPRKPRVVPGRSTAPAPRRGLASLATARFAVNPFEAGTSWIGMSGGLAGSKKNAQGFVDGLADAGWHVNFNWGDSNAWESDWRRNDDTWVDAADFVFYTGHANKDGWVLSNPDDTFLHFAEVGASPATPGDLWGQQDLEWVIVAACGPLQDELLAAGGGDVFDRWRGAFDGLHLLMGYGAVTFDNEEEGKLVVRYARDGQSLVSAWFRAAQEIQPSTNGFGAPDGPTVWVGAMYAQRSGTPGPGNDHLWGYGSVAADPTSPNVFVAMWTTT
jgi:hypothetical protein